MYSVSLINSSKFHKMTLAIIYSIFSCNFQTLCFSQYPLFLLRSEFKIICILPTFANVILYYSVIGKG
jgi:hypothetical protein